MNKKSKILAATFAAVAVCTVPFAMVGCNASEAEVGAVMSKAATNYYESHIDYSNFKNTTYTLSGNYENSRKTEITYLKKKGDETPVTKKVENYEKGTYKEVISIRKNGDDLSLYVNIKGSNSGYYYGTDEDGLLKKNKESESYETTYVMNKNENGYYITKTEVEKADGEESHTTSQYYQFESQAAYQTAFDGYISKLNQLVLTGSYFQLAQNEEYAVMYSSQLKYSKEFNTYKVNFSMSTPYIEYEDGDLNAIVYTMKMEETFNGNNVGTYKISMNGKSAKMEFKQVQALSVSNSAKSASNFKISLDGKTSVSSQLTVNLPTSMEMGM